MLLTGNAEFDSRDFRGWLVGHFVPSELGLRATSDVEIKWGTHTRGDARADWGTNDATTLSVLVSGCIRYEFADGATASLQLPGDYALWPAGVAHRWWIERDNTVVFTVRWPSRP